MKSLDVKAFKDHMRKSDGCYPETMLTGGDKTWLAALHKMRLMIPEFSFLDRDASIRWLREHYYETPEDKL